MDTNELIPTLALATLVLAAIAALVGFWLFKRKPANQHPMDTSSDGAIIETRVDPETVSDRLVPPRQN